MNAGLETFRLLVQIALRNLVVSRLKTVIIGGLIFSGTLLVVVGGSLLESVERSMQQSITGSVSGHIQIYSARSKDDLSIWGTMGGGDSDLATLDDFGTLRTKLEAVDNVSQVIPMGISGALIQSGNTIDLVLSELRTALNQRLAGDTSPSLLEQIESLKEHVRQQARVLEEDIRNVTRLTADRTAQQDALEVVQTSLSDGFWATFDADPLNQLELLENQLAPLATDADMLFLRYVGTDLERFRSTFDSLSIRDGELVPPGQRGFLFAKFFYEERLKLRTARRLDKIKEAIEGSGRAIARDEELQRFVKQNVSQVREIALQLDPIRTRTAVERLQSFLGSREPELNVLLAELLQTDDQNFQDRYRFFYDQLAPLLKLYRIQVGDLLTIKAVTRTGFIQSVNVRVYGTFDFKGLEKSALAGSLNLMDIMSFRDLYGYLTTDKMEEIARLKEGVNAAEITRESAEDALFGGGDTIVAEAQPGLIDLAESFGGVGGALQREDLSRRVYSQSELEDGVVLNAAVILENPKKLSETMTAIRTLSDTEGLNLKVVSWQEASGLLGQFVLVLRIVLYVAVFIIFVVALVVINNAMMMATLERVKEIGTLRAIGAQRRFVLQMLLIETLVVGALFGTLGAAVGGSVVLGIGQVGIPAFSDIMYFFFSGPRLHPSLGTGTLVAAFFIVLLVSAFSSFYPAWLATRVSPLVAMQSDE